MTRFKVILAALVVIVVVVVVVCASTIAADAQCHRDGSVGNHQKGCRWRGGRGMDPAHRKDMDLFHFLLDSRDEITRHVNNLPNGIETLTESGNPEVVKKLQAHVESMYKRLSENRPIHARDPLFAELFNHAEKVHVEIDKTKKGVRVVETSDDAYVVKLIQAHAKVVNLFLKNGRSEMRKDHELPASM